MSNIYRTLILCMAIGFLAVPAFAAGKFMTNDEMMKLIIGNSMTGKTESGDTYVEYYDPNGTIIGKSKKDGPYTGKWRFRQDNLMCFKYSDDPQGGGCVQLSKQGKKISIVRMDGSHEPTATWIKGKAKELQ